jgi:hypothetical protein
MITNKNTFEKNRSSFLSQNDVYASEAYKRKNKKEMPLEKNWYICWKGTQTLKDCLQWKKGQRKTEKKCSS